LRATVPLPVGSLRLVQNGVTLRKVVSLFALAALPLCSHIALAGGVSKPGGGPVIETLANGPAQGFSCSGCTPAQMQSLAASKGNGTWYVYNLTTNVINQYVVSCEPIAGGLSCYADLGTVPTGIANTFATYHSLWIGNHQSESFSSTVNINVPSGGPLNGQGMAVDDGFTNAYDTLQFSKFNNAILNMLNNPSTYSGATAQITQILEGVDVPGIKLDKLSSTVTVIFHDKSKRTYQFDKNLNTYKEVANSAIDSAGNTIPESKPHNGAGFFGDPNHVYNLPNIITILNADPPTFKDTTCLEEVWVDDPKMSGGGTLTCVKSP